jgi:hypothetical protein
LYLGGANTTVLLNSGTPAIKGVAYSTDTDGTIAYTLAPGTGECLQESGGNLVWGACDGVNYWALSAQGVVYPNIAAGASVLAATSSATTVGTFNTSGTNVGLLVTSSGDSLTVADLLSLTQTGTATTITNAINASDETITNALNVGANTITGTDWTIAATTDTAEGLTFTLAGGVGFDITGAATQDFRVTNTGGSIQNSRSSRDATVLISMPHMN